MYPENGIQMDVFSCYPPQSQPAVSLRNDWEQSCVGLKYEVLLSLAGGNRTSICFPRVWRNRCIQITAWLQAIEGFLNGSEKNKFLLSMSKKMLLPPSFQQLKQINTCFHPQGDKTPLKCISIYTQFVNLQAVSAPTSMPELPHPKLHICSC